MWVATQDLPRSAAHPFYVRLNQILEQHDFDGYVEGLCERFYADDGRPGLPPGRYFRLLPIGYFEGLDAERAIAWRAADSFALREFLALVLPEAPPDHSTISRTRRLRLLRLRGERLERPFAHLYETGGMRRVHLRGHTNIRKRLLIHTAGFNLGVLMRKLIGVGTPRGLQGRLIAIMTALLPLLHAVWKLLTGRERSVRHVSRTKRHATTESLTSCVETYQ